MPVDLENVPPFAESIICLVEAMPNALELPISQSVLAQSDCSAMPMCRVITLNVEPIRIAHRKKLASTKFAKIHVLSRILAILRLNVGSLIMWSTALVPLDSPVEKVQEEPVKRLKLFVDPTATVPAKPLASTLNAKILAL
jgi:hypothetical protein